MRLSVRCSVLAVCLVASTAFAAPPDFEPNDPWPEVKAHAHDGRFAEALKAVEQRLAEARAANNELLVARALVRIADLRASLGQFEGAVEVLRSERWPQALKPKTVVRLMYTQALEAYARRYRYELSRRTPRVGAKGPTEWTEEEIFKEIQAGYLELFSERDQLGKIATESMSDFFALNTFPKNIRPTLRDAVSYMYAQQLFDPTSWSPEESNSQELNKVELLLNGPLPAVLDTRPHPALRAMALLKDLEDFHAAAGRREAAFEALRFRIDLLWKQATVDEDRALLSAALERALRSVKGLPWSAMGMSTLGGQYLEGGETKKAHALFVQCEAAFGGTPGGTACRSQREQLEHPTFQLLGMSVDGAKKRSIAVDHTNVSELYFRAYSVDLKKRLSGSTERGLLPTREELIKLLAREKPVASWKQTLGVAKDFRPHITFVVPPMEKQGSYAVFASTKEIFAQDQSDVAAVMIMISDIVALTSGDERRGALLVRTVSGTTGKALGGVAVRQYRTNYNSGRYDVVHTGKTDASGRLSFPGRGHDGYYDTLLTAELGAQFVLCQNVELPWRSEVDDASSAALIYTDRSIYRPGQSAQFKVVLFRYDFRNKVSYEVRSKQPLTVSLLDGSGEVVAKKKLVTNAFGSASGTFELPAGRRLGHWALQTDVGEGSATLRVEEYKRPTFEATLETGGEMRLNQPVNVSGTARYYFGQPVRNGQVAWSVTREPAWTGRGFGYRPPEQQQLIASGAATTSSDGTFSFAFTPLADERKVRKFDLQYRYRVKATVLDEGGESHDVTRSYAVGIASVRATINLQKAFLAAGTAESLQIVRTTLEGAPRAGKGSWTLSELRPPTDGMLPADLPGPYRDARRRQPEAEPLSSWERTPGDELRPRWSSYMAPSEQLRTWQQKIKVGAGELWHGDDGHANVVLPALKAGVYRLRYTTRDDRGEEAVELQELVVADASFHPRLGLLMLVDPGSVEPGQRARVLVTSGIADLQMELELIRRDGRVERRSLNGSSPAIIELPITQADRGGIALSVTAVKDHQLMTEQAFIDVPFKQRELDVSFTTFRDELRPGVKESWTVAVKPSKGQQRQATELLAYMYDRSLDAFASHSPPTPLSFQPDGPSERSWAAQLEEHYSQAVHWVPRQLTERPTFWSDAIRTYGGWSTGGPGYGLGVESGERTRSLQQRRNQVIQVIRGGLSEASRTVRADVAAAAPMSPDVSEKDKALVSKPSAAKGPDQGRALRSDFSETAFFLPHLLTNADGSVSIEFTPPDAVTGWNIWAHAITKDVKSGSAQRTAKTSKDLLVRPYVPRFFREGDSAELRVVLTNGAATELKGELSLELLDPKSQVSVAAQWGLSTAKKPFALAARSSQTLSFKVQAPREVGEVAFKAVGTAGSWTDGELRVVPVLPSRLHLSQSRFAVLQGQGEKQLLFEDLLSNTDASLKSDQLVITVDAQLFESVLAALPYLLEYPYECTEQTLNRFLSAGILSSVMTKYPDVAKKMKAASDRKTPLEAFDRTDANRKAQLEETPWLIEARGGEEPKNAKLLRVLDPAVATATRDAAVRKLTAMQNHDGGFPWFPGGPSSTYMTLYLLNGFARGIEYGVPAPKQVVMSAWGYLASELRTADKRWMTDKDAPPAWLTFLAYVWSAYPDRSFMGGAVAEEDLKAVVASSFEKWRELPPYLKSMLAMTLARRDRLADAKLVFESVLDSAKADERLGMYWAAEDKSWLWYRDSIETHAMALQTLQTLQPKDPRRARLVQWLFLNKKLNQWKSTRATAEVIYALVKYLEAEGQLGVPEEPTVSVTTPTKTFSFTPAKNALREQWVVPGELVVAPTKIHASKQTKGTVFASATWHFATDVLPKRGDGDLLVVSRTYWKKVTQGTSRKLLPLTEGSEVQLGDELEVELKVRALHAAEYVHLRDPRGAGFEPISQSSRYKWEGGVGFFEEVRDTGNNFFFEQLPAGEYVLRYGVRASMTGVFRVGPAFAQSMYAPEFTAYSSGGTLEVR